MIGFGSGHTRAHAYRSLMEGMAFELCSNLERMADDLGHPVTELHAMGGGSRSALWQSILADATGLPLIRSSVAEVSAHGAAVLVMAAVGAYPSAEETAEGMCRRGERTDPDPGRAAEYRRWHAIQREFYPTVKDMFERIPLAVEQALAEAGGERVDVLDGGPDLVAHEIGGGPHVVVGRAEEIRQAVE
jgi:xylulokinase